MIDWKTILSSFDDKPTLLQWLKIVEKALQNASLEDVAIKNTGNNMYVFEFKFADGSTVTSSPINFLKEISGIEKVSDAIVGTQTLTTVRVNYIDGTSDEFSVAAENGKGISSLENISNAIAGTKTVTTIRVHYTDGTTEDISVAAENGKDGKAGKGVSSFEDIEDTIVGTQTYTTVRVHYTDGTTNDINIAAENGKGVREMGTISSEIAGNQTVTKIRAFYTDGTAEDLSVYAQNGSGGGSNIFMHKITGALDDTAQHVFKINFLSSDDTQITIVPEFIEFFKHNKCYIPTVAGNLMYHTVSLSADNNNIKLTGYTISGGTSIEGNAAQIVSDEVLKV